MSSGGAACKDRQGELANYGVCYKCKAKSKKALERLRANRVITKRVDGCAERW